MRSRTLLPVIGLVALAISVIGTAAETGRPHPDTLARVVQAIENLDTLRSGLAGSFESTGVPADKTTFKQVCKPVGLQAKYLAQEHGWQVSQMAAKYRHPSHQLDGEGQQVSAILAANPTLMGVWMRTTMEDQAGTRYFRRITVESACLACHGAKEKRPAFIQQDYPDDRAYAFQVGDLRGIYAVFVPDTP